MAGCSPLEPRQEASLGVTRGRGRGRPLPRREGGWGRASGSRAQAGGSLRPAPSRRILGLEAPTSPPSLLSAALSQSPWPAPPRLAPRAGTREPTPSDRLVAHRCGPAGQGSGPGGGSGSRELFLQTRQPLGRKSRLRAHCVCAAPRGAGGAGVGGWDAAKRAKTAGGAGRTAPDPRRRAGRGPGRGVGGSWAGREGAGPGALRPLQAGGCCGGAGTAGTVRRPRGQRLPGKPAPRERELEQERRRSRPEASAGRWESGEPGRCRSAGARPEEATERAQAWGGRRARASCVEHPRRLRGRQSLA